MARVIDEGMKAQLSKKQGFFLKYFPARIRNVGEDAKEARKLIYAFKDARDEAYKQVAQMVDSYLKKEYGEEVKDMVFLCVPASRQEVNRSRYKEFCKEVSRLSGIQNGYSHLILMEDRLAIHERRRGGEKEISKVSIMDFDRVRRYSSLMTSSPPAALMPFLPRKWRSMGHRWWEVCFWLEHIINIIRYETDFEQDTERCLYGASLYCSGEGSGA